jgi:hypothetical protein
MGEGRVGDAVRKVRREGEMRPDRSGEGEPMRVSPDSSLRGDAGLETRAFSSSRRPWEGAAVDGLKTVCVGTLAGAIRRAWGAARKAAVLLAWMRLLVL